MNLKNIVQCEIIVGEWISHLHIANNIDLNVLEMVGSQIIQLAGKLKEQAQQQAQQQQQQAQPVVDPVAEVEAQPTE